jgi:hypothetical protein
MQPIRPMIASHGETRANVFAGIMTPKREEMSLIERSTHRNARRKERG